LKTWFGVFPHVDPSLKLLLLLHATFGNRFDIKTKNTRLIANDFAIEHETDDAEHKVSNPDDVRGELTRLGPIKPEC
jgi:hypothetical protein